MGHVDRAKTDATDVGEQCGRQLRRVRMVRGPDGQRGRQRRSCEALLKLAAYTDKGSYRDLAENALKSIGEAAVRYPTAFARWLSTADFALGNVKQVVVLVEAQGTNLEALIQVVRSEYRPNVLVAASVYPPAQNAPSLLADRPLINGLATAYVCEGFVCKQPVTQTEELQAQL